MSTLDPTIAADLVRRIAAGEEQAATELVERCGAALRFLTRRFTRSEADAEDLYQETLMLALEKIRRGEVREPERLAGFLRALAKNLSLGRYRRRSYGAEQPTANLPDTPDESRPGPLDDLLGGETRRLTRVLLAELGVARDREVLLRYYIAEQSSANICAELGIETEHFYRVLHRARQRYRQLWEAQAGAG